MGLTSFLWGLIFGGAYIRGILQYIEDVENKTLFLLGIKDIKKHKFSKGQVVDVSFQIYVPSGTKLSDTRKSTWMNPLANGAEAMKLLGKKGIQGYIFKNYF